MAIAAYFFEMRPIGCNIVGNNPLNAPGGIYISNSSPIISKCNINYNREGAIQIKDNSSAMVKNCNIIGNGFGYWAYGFGWISVANSSLTIVNSTISQNYISGELSNENVIDVPTPDSILTVKNSIIWEAEGKAISGYFDPNLITFSYINQDGFEGNNGNIRQDPLFVDPDNGDFHLNENSPCIDAGTAEGAPNEDIEGIFRPQGGGFDMGAYEYLVVSIDTILNYFDVFSTNGTLIGTGPGRSAGNRLDALRNMLENVVELLDANEIERACGQLNSIYKKCDGENRPPDFVTGEAVPQLNTMISELMEQLGCD